MRLPMAATELLTTPTQGITDQDVYKVDGVSTITDVKDVLSTVTSDVVNAARNTPGFAANMASVVAGVKSGSMTKADAAMRVAGVLGGNSGILNKLSNTVKTNVLGTLGIEGKKADAVMTTIAGVARVAQYGDVTRISDMMDIFGTVTGNDELMSMVDLGAEAALLGGIMREVISLGIPDGIQILMQQASSPEQRYQIGYQNLSYGIYSGDVNTMTYLIDAVGAATVKANYPTYIRDFLARYKRPLGMKEPSYPVEKAKIIALFNQVDTNWDKSLYGPNYIPSLTPFSQMSDDARAVFMSTPEHQVQILLAQTTVEVDLVQWIKENYPYFPG